MAGFQLRENARHPEGNSFCLPGDEVPFGPSMKTVSTDWPDLDRPTPDLGPFVRGEPLYPWGTMNPRFLLDVILDRLVDGIFTI